MSAAGRDTRPTSHNATIHGAKRIRMSKKKGKAPGPTAADELEAVSRKEAPPTGRAGLVAVVGLPNAGKSTLVNALVGEKVSAVSATPQTTRTLIRGIRTEERGQAIFLDTPGFHQSGPLLNQQMGESLSAALAEAHVVLWVVDITSKKRDRDFARFLDLIRSPRRGEGGTNPPLVVALTKIDRLGATNMIPALLEFSKEMDRHHISGEIVPLSGLKGTNLDPLCDLLFRALPEGEPLFDPEWFTSQTMREMVREIVQEKIFSLLYEEVPHQCAVAVEEFHEPNPDEKATRIEGSILVERESQKGIVVGSRGETIRTISQRAREEIERLTGTPVYLRLVVRVVPDWRDRPAILRELGYLPQ